MGLFDFRLLSFIGIKIPPRAPWRKYYHRKHMNIRLKAICLTLSNYFHNIPLQIIISMI